MKSTVRLIRSQLALHRSFLIYGFISVFVTVIDVAVCRICEVFLPSVVANTIGVVTGFLIQYFLTARHVYNTKNLKSFVVFLWTFFVGLLFADGIVYVSRAYIFGGADSTMAFLVSKAFSIVLPFFLMYFLRKKFMPASDASEQCDGCDSCDSEVKIHE